MGYSENEKFPEALEILKAKELISNFAHKTPIHTSTFFNKMLGGEFYFKCDNFQRSGSFKFRGATNAVMALSGEKKKKVLQLIHQEISDKH